MSSRSLSTGVTSPLSPVGSLAEEGDERPSLSFLVHSFATNRNISSSFDHRIIDGWDAASFIQRIKGLLENPAALFVD